MLPGMYIGPGMAGLNGSLAYFDHYVSSSVGEPVLPSGIASGDLIVAFSYTGGLGTPQTPSGYTSISAGSGGPKYSAACKIADGTETGSLTMFSSAASKSLVFVLRGHASALGSIVDVNGETTASNPTAQVLNVSTVGSLPFVAVAFYAASAAIDPRTFSGETPDGEYGDSSIYFKWKYFDSASIPSDITVDMDDEGSQALVSAIIEVTF